MFEFLKKDQGIDDFIISRNGREAEQLISTARNSSTIRITGLRRTLSDIRHLRLRNLFRRLFSSEVMEMGRFRRSGEIHQWMYDRFSLSQLLTSCGFREVCSVSAFESGISDWPSYNLDGADGVVRKPDSLFMEALK